MAVPKRKTSKARRNKRKSSWLRRMANNISGVVACDNCGELKLPHRVCKSCGTYKGRNVMEAEDKE